MQFKNVLGYLESVKRIVILILYDILKKIIKRNKIENPKLDL